MQVHLEIAYPKSHEQPSVASWWAQGTPNPWSERQRPAYCPWHRALVAPTGGLATPPCAASLGALPGVSCTPLCPQTENVRHHGCAVPSWLCSASFVRHGALPCAYLVPTWGGTKEAARHVTPGVIKPALRGSRSAVPTEGHTVGGGCPDQGEQSPR